MADNMSRKDRSRTMSRIRSRWTMQEKLVHEALEIYGVEHIMHPKIPGGPDVVIPSQKIALFLNGCFWHKCPLCYMPPKTHDDYWLPKLEKNVQRDIANKRTLEDADWRVVVIWEHEVKKLKPEALGALLKFKGIKISGNNSG